MKQYQYFLLLTGIYITPHLSNEYGIIISFVCSVIGIIMAGLGK